MLDTLLLAASPWVNPASPPEDAPSIAVSVRLAARIAYPAYAFGTSAMTETPRYAGALAMGSRLAIGARVSLASLNLATPEGMLIAQAAKEFGFFIVDRGGEGISVRVQRKPVGKPSRTLRKWNYGLQQ